jgi:hypothetical protein
MRYHTSSSLLLGSAAAGLKAAYNLYYAISSYIITKSVSNIILSHLPENLCIQEIISRV